MTTTTNTTEKKTATLPADLIAIATEQYGLRYRELKTYHCVEADDRSKCLYISKSKTKVSHVHASGFVPEIDGEPIQGWTTLTKDEAKELRLGRVRGILEPGKLRDDVDWMSAFHDACAVCADDSQAGFKVVGKAKSGPEVLEGEAADSFIEACLPDAE